MASNSNNTKVTFTKDAINFIENTNVLRMKIFFNSDLDSLDFQYFNPETGLSSVTTRIGNSLTIGENEFSLPSSIGTPDQVLLVNQSNQIVWSTLNFSEGSQGSTGPTGENGQAFHGIWNYNSSGGSGNWYIYDPTTISVSLDGISQETLDWLNSLEFIVNLGNKVYLTISNNSIYWTVLVNVFDADPGVKYIQFQSVSLPPVFSNGDLTKFVFSIDGKTGPQGSQGEIGSQGDIGAQGDVGAQGPQGEIGAQGPQGDVGAQGPQGEIGAQGPQGEIGAQGPQGDVGSQGSQGDVGPQGAQGAQGLGYYPVTSIYVKTFAYGNVEWTVNTTGAFISGMRIRAILDSNTTLYMEGYAAVNDVAKTITINVDKMSGTVGSQYISGWTFGIAGNVGSQGPQGEIGSQGPQGEIGPTGLIDYFIQSDNRNNTNISTLNSDFCLSTIEQLNVYNFDQHKQGMNINNVFGFIGEEISTLVPNAFSLKSDFVGNILNYYSTTLVSTINQNNIIQYNYEVDISDTGLNPSKVELSTDVGIIYANVQSNICKFNTNTLLSNVYVYGSEVNDVQSIEYSYLFSLNIGATKELQNLVKNQQSTIDSLQSTVNYLLSTIM